MCKNIVLIGFMGTGKTTTGILVSKSLKYNFVDTDTYIENEVGIPVSEIFKKYGEQYFRSLEKKVIYNIMNKKRTVVSTGGGIVLDKENLNIILSKGIVFALEASVDIIWKRLENSNDRPLLYHSNKKKLMDLYNKRLNLYNKAHYIVNVDEKTPEQVSKMIVDTLLKET